MKEHCSLSLGFFVGHDKLHGMTRMNGTFVHDQHGLKFLPLTFPVLIVKLHRFWKCKTEFDIVLQSWHPPLRSSDSHLCQKCVDPFTPNDDSSSSSAITTSTEYLFEASSLDVTERVQQVQDKVTSISQLWLIPQEES